MTAPNTDPLVWVKDDAGNRFLCSFSALRDPNKVTEDEKKNCVGDASSLMSKRVPGDEKLDFGKTGSRT